LAAGSTTAMSRVTQAEGEAPRRTWSHFRTSHALLIAVCVGYTALIAIRTSQVMLPTWDEVVYASQFAGHVPDDPGWVITDSGAVALYTPPRSLGMPLLLAPVTMLTSSIFALRVYLMVLAGLFMYLAFRPWLSVLRPHGFRAMLVVPVAAGLFVTLWTSVLYGSMAYPNVWLAFALTSGVGLFCLAASKQRATSPVLIAIVFAFAAASLIRPTDSVAAAAPIIAVALIRRTSRWLAPAIAVAGGLAIGWGVWIVESFALFGNPIDRLRSGAEFNEGGLTLSLGLHLDAVDGPRAMCRPHTICDGLWLPSGLWWLCVPVVVGIGIFAARRAGWLAPIAIAVACGLGVALQYLLLIDYANPRFLQPTYALVALPAAAALLWVVTKPTSVLAKAVAVTVSSVGLLAHFGVQQIPLDENRDILLDTSRRHGSAYRALDHNGVEPPCLVVGQGAIQIGYMLHCRSISATEELLPETELLITDAIESGSDVAVRIDGKAAVPDFMGDWSRLELPAGGYVAYVPPLSVGATR
jgi:hypothetical protein